MKLYMTCGARNDFYLLQCVKGAWAFQKLVAFMGSLSSKHEVLLAFVRCVIAVYVARGRPFIAISNPRDEDAAEEREEEERRRKAAAEAGVYGAGDATTGITTNDPDVVVWRPVQQRLHG